MNNTNILELVNVLGNRALPQLKTYAYTSLISDGLAVVIMVLIAGIFWKYRDKMVVDEIPVGKIISISILSLIVLVLVFSIPSFLHTLTTPELEAIRLIVNSTP